jgi:hypothetical protein
MDKREKDTTRWSLKPALVTSQPKAWHTAVLHSIYSIRGAAEQGLKNWLNLSKFTRFSGNWFFKNQYCSFKIRWKNQNRRSNFFQPTYFLSTAAGCVQDWVCSSWPGPPDWWRLSSASPTPFGTWKEKIQPEPWKTRGRSHCSALLPFSFFSPGPSSWHSCAYLTFFTFFHKR